MLHNAFLAHYLSSDKILLFISRLKFLALFNALPTYALPVRKLKFGRVRSSCSALVKMSLKDYHATCALVFIVTCVTNGETLICDTCTCKDGIVNCTDSGLTDILDLWDHTEALNDAILVNFDYNGIVHVKQLPPSKVVYLSLQHNKINAIDDFAFAHLSSLKDLDLRYNCLTTESLKPAVFKMPGENSRKPRLVRLRLDYNNLHSLLPRVFEGLGNLVLLSLAGNPLKIIDQTTSLALTSLPLLRVLDLSNTSLSELPNYILHTPRFLETLDLSKNEFTQVPQALTEVHSLTRLDFSSNPIQSISNFPKMPSLRVLHVSYMPELKTIGPRAFSLLPNLYEFYCTHNYKLESIDPTVFSYKSNDESKSESWPDIVKLHLSYNSLGYLDSRLLARWDSLQELSLQGNKWVCDCNNQWLVSTLAPMVESRHPDFLDDFTCQLPIEMSGISILDLDHRNYHLRCLDVYNNRPEKDGILLIGILIGVILTIPFTMGTMMYCAKRKNSPSYYQRIFNYKNPYNPADFQLRESSIYQPTSIITDGY